MNHASDPPSKGTAAGRKKMSFHVRLSQMMPPRIGPAMGPTSVVIAHSTVQRGLFRREHAQQQKLRKRHDRPADKAQQHAPSTSMPSEPDRPQNTDSAAKAR
jgi:hypothetical protein